MVKGDRNKKGLSSSSSSYWRKDLSLIDVFLKEDFFVNNCRFVIANGYNTPFWHAKYIRDFYLKGPCSLLFGLSSLKEVAVAGMRGWREGVWCWGDFRIPFVVVQ